MNCVDMGWAVENCKVLFLFWGVFRRRSGLQYFWRVELEGSLKTRRKVLARFSVLRFCMVGDRDRGRAVNLGRGIGSFAVDLKDVGSWQRGLLQPT